MSAPLVILAIVSLLGLCLGIAFWPRRRADHPASRAESSPTNLGSTVPSERTIGLKVCPECREFVLLEHASCKYCGSAQSIAPFTPSPAPDLKLPRRTED